MNQLDLLEKRIRALFESSAAILSWNTPTDRIVHELVIAVQDLFVTKFPDDQLTAPVFIVNLNPLTINVLEEQSGWEEKLSEILTTTAAEYGTHFHSSPSVQISADASLARHEVAIFLKQSASLPKIETGILSSEVDNVSQLDNHTLTPVPILILKGDKTLQLIGSVINIGRKNSNHIVINDLRVSRSHAQIRKVKEDYVIFDVGSSGGTFINSNRIDQHILRPGDVISLAGYTMIFTLDQLPADETQRNITSEIKNFNEGMDN